MKNSSRFDAMIAANFARSSSGLRASAASSSTRSLNASHDSSRLKNAGSSEGRSGAHDSTPAPAITTRRPNTSVSMSARLARPAAPSSGHRYLRARSAASSPCGRIVTSCTFGRCSASSALASRRMAASLFTRTRSSRLRLTYCRCVFCGSAAPMVAGDVRDDLHVVARQAEDLGASRMYWLCL